MGAQNVEKKRLGLQMTANRKNVWALVAFLTIPVIYLVGGALFTAVDPERLAGHTHYVRNYRLLEFARSAIMLAMFGSVVVAWFLAALLLLRSKCRTYRWLPLALLGPIGFVFLASLRDLSPHPSDLYERFNRRLTGFFRGAYEVVFFILGLSLAWQMMLVKRETTIFLESAVTGQSRDQIRDHQNAQSAMWAFSELNEVMYFLVLLYLLRPVCVNVVGSLFKHRGPSRVA
jgi:hypothetical protein